MRTISILVTGIAPRDRGECASAQVEGGARRLSGADREANAHEKRAKQLRPRRRDEPLRYLNISDNEVREIQLMAEKYLPKVLLNISPVVTGCPCEEGPQCTDQVYIVAETPQSSKGLQMSRVRNAWVVGNVQQWWLKHDELSAKRRRWAMRSTRAQRANSLRDFPMCVGELVPAENTTASTPKAETEEMTKKRASITVRPVKPEDYDAWRPLWDEYNVFYERTGPTALSEEMNDTLWRRFFDASEPVHCIVAEREHKVVGICHYLYHRSTSRMELLCYLQDLFTAPDYRGHGIGRALIERVYKIAKEAGCKRVYWQTHTTNTPGRTLYDKVAKHFGFIVYAKDV